MEHQEYLALLESEADHWWFVSLREKVFRAIRSRIVADRKIFVFDAGCGTGFLVKQLSDTFPKSIQVECCEPSPHGRAAASRYNISPLPTTIADLPDSLHGRYDVVTCIDVLYHRDVAPAIAVRKLRNLLKPGGTLIVNTASLPCLRRQHDNRVHGGRRFTKAQITNIIVQENLRLLQIYYWNVHLVPVLYLYTMPERLLGRTLDDSSDVRTPRLLNTFFLFLSKLESFLPIGSRNMFRPFGTSIFLVAEKPL